MVLHHDKGSDVNTSSQQRLSDYKTLLNTDWMQLTLSWKPNLGNKFLSDIHSKHDSYFFYFDILSVRFLE